MFTGQNEEPKDWCLHRKFSWLKDLLLCLPWEAASGARWRGGRRIYFLCWTWGPRCWPRTCHDVMTSVTWWWHSPVTPGGGQGSVDLSQGAPVTGGLRSGQTLVTTVHQSWRLGSWVFCSCPFSSTLWYDVSHLTTTLTSCNTINRESKLYVTWNKIDYFCQRLKC